VKKAFQRLFQSSEQTEVRDEFACFAVGLEDFADISALEERSTMNLIKWWTSHGENGVYLQSLATRFLSHLMVKNMCFLLRGHKFKSRGG
jgi:hypothetical protein